MPTRLHDSEYYKAALEKISVEVEDIVKSGEATSGSVRRRNRQRGIINRLVREAKQAELLRADAIKDEVLSEIDFSKERIGIIVKEELAELAGILNLTPISINIEYFPEGAPVIGITWSKEGRV